MARCFGTGDDLYTAYHDTEWGVPPEDFGTNEAELFERLSLEVFQVGLSWLLVLRRRGAFREAFAGFDPHIVAQFTADDVDRLAANPAIIRNRRKIEATINNARCLTQMHEHGDSLAGVLAAHRPAHVVTRRSTFGDVPAHTEEAVELAKELKRRGFTFVGPTNVYAMMQALGIVDDHLASCPAIRERGASSGEDRARDVWDETSQSNPVAR